MEIWKISSDSDCELNHEWIYLFWFIYESGFWTLASHLQAETCCRIISKEFRLHRLHPQSNRLCYPPQEGSTKITPKAKHAVVCSSLDSVVGVLK